MARKKSLFFPMLLVAIGVVLFLINIGKMEGTIWSVLNTYWPVLLILGGLDGLYRQEGWVGTLVMLGLGVILLLGNLGYFGHDAWWLLLRLWPVLIVAWGVDLALGKHPSVWGMIGKIALGTLIVLGIFWLAVALPFSGKATPLELSQKLDNATSAVFNFSLAAGEVDLTAGDQKDMLVTGEIYLPEDAGIKPVYAQSSDGKSQYRVELPGSTMPGTTNTMSPWRIAINPEIPSELTVQMGAGEMNLDLTGTGVEEITTELAVGRIDVILPESQSISGKAAVAVGEMVIHVPQCAAITFKTGTALTDLSLPAGYTRDGDIVRNQVPQGCGKYLINLDLDLAIGSISIVKIP